MPFHLRIFLVFITFFFTCFTLAHANDLWNNHPSNRDSSTIIFLKKMFQPFGDFDDSARYEIRLCADIPYNKNPKKIVWKNETGHVFIILTKTTFGPEKKSISKSFGFYPIHPVASVIFKKARSTVKTNNNREYDVSISKIISAEEFRMVLQKAVELSRRKYHLNNYNCYDYGVAVFNTITGIEKVPQTKVKLPFICGRAGAPYCLYRDLTDLCKQNRLTANISFDVAKSPPDPLSR